MVAATAAGYAQTLLCDSAIAGLLLLAATLVVAPRAALAAAGACLAATVVARARRYPKLAWRRGLYGYAGALVGLFWAALFDGRPPGGVLLLVAAVAAPFVTRLAQRTLASFDLPALAVPALALTWLAVPVLGVTPAAPAASPVRLGLAAAIALIAVATWSRLAAAAAMLGMLVGLAVSAPVGPGMESLVVSNTVPTALALAAVFVPFSGGSLLVAAGAAATAGVLSVGLAMIPAGLPILVLPFNAVTVATLVLLRSRSVRRLIPGRPAALPLAAVWRPEHAARQWRARARFLALVRDATSLCVFTGAGVSTAAGLPDFRGPFGLGTRARRITLEDFVASLPARAEYWRQEEAFYRRARQAAPTAVHRALAEMYRRGRLAGIVTQNVDGLHQAAGVPEDAIVEIHGNLRRVRCMDCGMEVPRDALSDRIAAAQFNLYCPACQGLLQSGGVMFGEAVDPDRLGRALRALLASDLLVVLGTSLSVFPAADMVRWAREAGIPVVIANATPTPFDEDAAVALIGDVGPILEDATDVALGA